MQCFIFHALVSDIMTLFWLSSNTNSYVNSVYEMKHSYNCRSERQKKKKLFFSTWSQSDPTERSHCLLWLLSMVRKGLWELILEPGTNWLCHVLLGEKFRHLNLGLKTESARTKMQFWQRRFIIFFLPVQQSSCLPFWLYFLRFMFASTSSSMK